MTTRKTERLFNFGFRKLLVDNVRFLAPPTLFVQFCSVLGSNFLQEAAEVAEERSQSGESKPEKKYFCVGLTKLNQLEPVRMEI